MKNKISIRYVDKKPVRACFNNKDSCWYYAVMDVVAAFIVTANPKRYWGDIKRRNKGISLKCKQFKLTAKDGKKYNTDVIRQDDLIELLSLLPKKDNENIKNWLNNINSSIDEQSKYKAYQLYDSGLLNKIEVGTTKGLKQIHSYIFARLYDFAGQIRNKTIMKDGFIFCRAEYLKKALSDIDKMPETNLQEIINKYVEMNVAHPFFEGNGRSTRIWLDLILKKNLNKCVDWSLIDKKQYLEAMRESSSDDKKIYKLIKKSLTDKTDDRGIFMKGIDYSYYYEDVNYYDDMEDIVNNKISDYEITYSVDEN